jgi:Enoyl-CoA hydratase/isomerase
VVDDLEIPTIGVINGPGFHTEMLLMCDITICSDDTIIYDLHYDIGSVPGDGIHSCFQELLGVKRAAYALLTGHAIDAKTLCRRGGFDRPCLFWKDTMKISGSFVSTDWSKRSRGIVGPRDVIQIEIIDRHDWREVESPDGVLCYVTRLRREPAMALAA